METKPVYEQNNVNETRSEPVWNARMHFVGFYTWSSGHCFKSGWTACKVFIVTCKFRPHGKNTVFSWKLKEWHEQKSPDRLLQKRKLTYKNDSRFSRGHRNHRVGDHNANLKNEFRTSMSQKRFINDYTTLCWPANFRDIVNLLRIYVHTYLKFDFTSLSLPLLRTTFFAAFQQVSFSLKDIFVRKGMPGMCESNIT